MREIALHVLDLLQNTVEAGAANVSLALREDIAGDRLTIVVTDDGRGMDAETAARVTDPFYTTRTTRHVGLGLPLLAAACERADGQMTIVSEPGRGARIEASFRWGHPDRQPLGDMAGTLLAFLLSEHSPELSYRHWRNERSFEFETATLHKALDGLPFGEPAIRRWLADFLDEGEEDLIRE